MTTRLALKLLLALLLSSPLVANAVEDRDVRDGDRVTAPMALREPTRIKVEGEPITDIVGDIYDKQNNPYGRAILQLSKEKGDAVLRLRDDSMRPVNLFVYTNKAAYTLILQPKDVPSDAVVLHDRTPAPRLDNTSNLKAPNFHRMLKNMLVTMATGAIISGVEVKEVGVDQVLWKEARLTLQRSFISPQVVGDQYILTNRSGKEMVLTEQELDKDGVLAISIENQRLHAGDYTNVFIVRKRGDNE